jgi:tetratricopeptide (TPR) repeat protein
MEAAVPDAEQLEDPAPLAATLANLARANMRLANTEAAIAAADRALAIAERLNLEPVIAEALVNKASALNIQGRRREASALHIAALELAQRGGDRTLELRIRNNYASAVGDDDPASAIRMMAEGAELARDIGDRGMYYWLTGMTAVSQMQEGVLWDEHLAKLKDAIEGATIRQDRLRLRIFIGLIETARGESMDEYLSDIEELSRDDTSKDDQFGRLMTVGYVAMRRHQYERAYRASMEAYDLQPQNPDVPLGQARAAAIRSLDHRLIREVAERTAELPSSGAMTELQRRTADAALAAIDGRTADAVATFQAVHAEYVRLGQRYVAAVIAIDAATLLPDQAPIRALAEAGRPLLEELRATADLEDLDIALAAAPAPASEAARAAGASAPTRRPG